MPTIDYGDVRKLYPEWFPAPQRKFRSETTVRVLSGRYLKEHGYRLAPIDFSVIPEMIGIVEATNFVRLHYRLEIMGHLLDAHNEDLPHYVRVQHFDLAGSRYWDATDRGQHTIPRFMVLFRQAGGV